MKTSWFDNNLTIDDLSSRNRTAQLDQTESKTNKNISVQETKKCEQRNKIYSFFLNLPHSCSMFARNRTTTKF